MSGPAGITPLAGLQPATGQPSYYTEGWADPYEQIRGPAPEHAQFTWNDPPAMPWLMIQDQRFHEPDPGTLPGAAPPVLGAGSDPSLYASPTETGSHAAPWPAFGVEDFDPRDTGQAAARAQANQDLHAADTGQPAAFTMRDGLTTPWRRGDYTYDSAGESLLEPVPDQLRGNLMASRHGGFESRTQGYGPVNEHDFDTAHVHQPQAAADVAGNYLWLTPAARPVLVRPTGYRDWPVGPDSPFAGQVPGTGGLGDPTGAVVDAPPPAYSAPPQPETAPALAGDQTVWSTW